MGGKKRHFRMEINHKDIIKMKVAVFSTEPYDRKFLEEANHSEKIGHEFTYFEARLEAKTAALAEGCRAICAFVNDDFCLDLTFTPMRNLKSLRMPVMLS